MSIERGKRILHKRNGNEYLVLDIVKVKIWKWWVTFICYTEPESPYWGQYIRLLSNVEKKFLLR